MTCVEVRAFGQVAPLVNNASKCMLSLRYGIETDGLAAVFAESEGLLVTVSESCLQTITFS
jgi:hypothetical protein